jgi:hypothetical protein
VTPGDPEELAAVLRELHDSAAGRARLSAAALSRVQERFAWPAVARATVAEYRKAIAGMRAARTGALGQEARGQEARGQEAGGREAGGREAGGREAGAREAGAREAGAREAGAREAGETVVPC